MTNVVTSCWEQQPTRQTVEKNSCSISQTQVLTRLLLSPRSLAEGSQNFLTDPRTKFCSHRKKLLWTYRWVDRQTAQIPPIFDIIYYLSTAISLYFNENAVTKRPKSGSAQIIVHQNWNQSEFLRVKPSSCYWSCWLLNEKAKTLRTRHMSWQTKPSPRQ